MAYIGQQPVVGRYILLDQISGGFDGSASGFTMSTAGGAQGVKPGLAQNVLLSLGGVIQQPGVDYTISGSGLTFTTPPVSGTTFFATVLGDAQSVGTPSDGTVTPASIASGFDFGFPNVNVTGVTTIASGSAAVPSLTITGDTDTGLFSPGANTLAVTTSGIQRTTIDASGRLLVGVNAVPTGLIGTSSHQIIKGNATTANGVLGLIRNAANPAVDTGIGHIFFGDADGNAGVGIQGVADGDWATDDYPSRLVFSTTLDGGSAPTERMRIDNSGRVGIGNTSPNNFFDQADNLVIGNTGNNGITIVAGTTSVGRIHFADGTSGDERFRGFLIYDHNNDALQLGAAGGTAVHINSSQNVGIGSTDPGQRMVVRGSQPFLEIRDSREGSWDAGDIFSGILFGTDDTTTAVDPHAFIRAVHTRAGTGHTAADAGLTFGTSENTSASAIERMRIEANTGRVGINETSPDRTLHVRSDGSYALKVGGESGGEYYLELGQVSASSSPCINYSGTSAALRFLNNGDNAARFDSSSRLLIGNTSNIIDESMLEIFRDTGCVFGIYSTDATTGNTCKIVFAPANNVAGSQIICEAEEDFSTSANRTARLEFWTRRDGTLAERMRIRSNGDVTTTTDASFDRTTAGFTARNGDAVQVTRSSGTPFEVSRTSNDGTLVQWFRDNTVVGTITVASGTVSYNPFLGSHWARLEDGSKPEILPGTILETINKLVDWRIATFTVNGEQKISTYHGPANVGDTVQIEYEGETYDAIVSLEEDPTGSLNKHVCVKVSDTAASAGVYGVFLGWDEDVQSEYINTWNDLYCAAVGNYFIRIAAGQTVAIGDLIESNGTGCGVVQSDDIIRSKTVGKVTSTIAQETYADGSFLVTCVLCCG